jgi:hypothetical protein
MKKLIILVFTLSVCLSSGVSLALAQTADNISSNVKDIYPKWAAVKKDIDVRDFERAKTGLKEIEGMCLDRGITSFEELSASMVKQGKDLLQAKEIKGALLLFDSAIQISPNYPPPYYARGWAYLSQDKLTALVFVDSFIDGFRNLQTTLVGLLLCWQQVYQHTFHPCGTFFTVWAVHGHKVYTTAFP